MLFGQQSRAVRLAEDSSSDGRQRPCWRQARCITLTRFPSSRWATLVCLLALGISASIPQLALAQQNPIPATNAFQSPACAGVDHALGDVSPARINPEWKPILVDPKFPIPYNNVTILEGTVPSPKLNEVSKDQATSEVSEEETPTNHYTHDFTFKVVPDQPYFHLLSSWVDPSGTVLSHSDMEVEWENASLMDEQPDGSQRDWGAVPEFVWPAVGDRVWVEGRWVFDCGHPSSSDDAHVQFSTEIHPPRALVTYRLNHLALDSFPRPRSSAPNFPFPQSYLPVTGEPIMLPILPYGPPTSTPLTEADIFVSVNGGGANDLCNMVPSPCEPYFPPSPPAPAGGYHRTPIIPVNDRSYVFDIYPPGTCYGLLDCPLVNGTFPVTPPTPDASLQWRVVDHSDELPRYACGVSPDDCATVDPIICLIDAATPPPPQDQSQVGTACPPVPGRATRLRVILPFAGSNATYFARSILLGWDDVPAPATPSAVRTFEVRLDKFTVKSDGNSLPGGADWRVFVNVGGQYRYMSPFFDTDANNGTGIYKYDSGNNAGHGDKLTNNGDNDWFQFDNTPWTVSVADGTPIHVAVGGYKADHNVEDDFCRHFFSGCDFSTIETGARLILFDFNRIGTYEFDLIPPDYSPPTAFKTDRLDCNQHLVGFDCGLQYEVQFSVNEISPTTPPVSLPLVIGLPSYAGGAGTYISASTPMIPQTADPSVEGFQYRFHKQGGALPTYGTVYGGTTYQFPVHWAHVDLESGSNAADVRIGSANVGDGPYEFQYSAESFGNLLEPRHFAIVVLDSTPPQITIAQPQAIQYTHSASLTLNYAADDGTGAGVQNTVAKIDGAATLPGGQSLADGQTIKLLTQLSLGTHVFTVDSVDNVNNASTRSVTFSIVVTSDSIKDDVTQFLSGGAIKNAGLANSLLAKLNAAAAARAAGDCSSAASIYEAFIREVSAQSGKGVDAAAAAIMIADAQYLIAHCP